MTTEIAVRGAAISSVAGQVLASHDIHDHNDFDHPNAVMAAAAELGLPTLASFATLPSQRHNAHLDAVMKQTGVRSGF